MAILYGLAIVVGLILLVIPGIILSISLCLAFYLVALENKGAVDSLKSSHALVKGYWWRTATADSYAFASSDVNRASQLKQHNFGATIGGPLRKSRDFPRGY